MSRTSLEATDGAANGATDGVPAPARDRETDALVEALPDALARFDPELRLRFANRAAAALFGGEPGALLGRTPREAALPDVLAERLENGVGDALARGATVHDELHLDTAAGPRWYGARFVPVDGGVLAILVDTSERKRIVAALAERERRLERTLEEVDTLYRNLPIGLCVVGPERRLLRLNAQLSAVYDEVESRSRALVGHRLHELHPGFDALIGPSLDAAFVDGASRLGRELVGPLGPGGERRWWIVDLLPLRDELGDTRAISCTVQDITVRKLGEQRLAARAAATEVLAAARDLDAAIPDLLDAVGDAFDAHACEWWTAPADGASAGLAVRRTRPAPGEPPGDAARDAAGDAAGGAAGDAPASPWRGLPDPVGPDGLVTVVGIEGHARRRASSPSVPGIDAGPTGPANRVAAAAATLTALGFPVALDGATLGVIVVFVRGRLPNDAQLLEALEQIGRDVGECERRLRDGRALEQARAAAELANRSKSDFLANVSHELRSPLTAILGYADLLEARLEDADDRRSVDTIRGNGRHLLALLNDILDLAKIESGKYELDTGEAALVEVVGEVHALMAVRAAERELDFGVELRGLLPERIVTDPLRLRQILINLVANAIKFTDTGGVRIRVRALGANAPGARLAFDVVDTGIGMTRDQRERLFEPFTQVDASNTRRYGGTGLGLAISRRLAALLDGELAVRSVPGRGTTFTLELPLRLAPGAALAPASLAAPPDPPPVPDVVRAGAALDARVLVADDRPDIRTLVTRFLEGAGARVVAVADGEAVLEALDPRHGPPPDAVVMDMQMPRLDGYQATRRLRASGYERPVLALTAAAMVGERERCLEAGCDDYLSKPIDGGALVDALVRLLAARRAPPADAPAAVRVLLVDDAADVREVTMRLLERTGHDVRGAADGPEALELAARWRPDAVLLDLGLPGMDGHEVARRLRDAYGDALRIVALSGRAPRAGADGPFDHQLQKPAKLRALTDYLATVPVRPDRGGEHADGDRNERDGPSSATA